MRPLLVAAILAACSSSPATAPTAPASPVAPMPSGQARGQVVHTSFASEALGVKKDIVVYLPAGYDAAAAKRWPVVLYLHGLTGDETNWTDGGQLEETANRLGVGAIVVMPDGDDSFYADSLTAIDYQACLADGTGLFFPQRSHKDTCVRTAKYEQYITQDVVSWVDREYRTLGTRESRGIAGLSMGGFGALMLALRHPDQFAAAASHSGVIALLFNGPIPYAKGQTQLVTDPTQWGRAVGPLGAWVRGIFGPDLANWKAHDPASLVQTMPANQVALYIDCGTEDEFKLEAQAAYVHDLLLDRGIDHVYYLGPGGHDMDFWRARLPESLAFFQAKLASAR